MVDMDNDQYQRPTTGRFEIQFFPCKCLNLNMLDVKIDGRPVGSCYRSMILSTREISQIEVNGIIADKFDHPLQIYNGDILVIGWDGPHE